MNLSKETFGAFIKSRFKKTILYISLLIIIHITSIMEREPPNDLDNKATLTKPMLTKTEQWDISFLVLAFSCVVASVTLVVGTGPMVILSVGGSNSLAPFSLAAIFMGMSIVSLTATHWIFALWGRRIGFWVGCGLGLVGSLVACWGLLESSPAIILFAQFLTGAGMGIGMYLRYSAVEVVSSTFSSRAVSWVLGGGCLAAFVGPELSHWTKGMLGDENLTYVVPFLTAASFFILQAFCVGLVGFPSPKQQDDDSRTQEESPVNDADDDIETKVSTPISDSEGTLVKNSTPTTTVSLSVILCQQCFLLPLGVATLSWAIMAMPMAIFRVAMKDLGFTERQSLTVLEFHFLAMYAPGFWSGSFIKKYGVLRACQVGLLCFVISLGIHLCIQDNTRTTIAWFLGLIFIGVGWNFSFSSATVWSTQSYQHAMYLKSKVQAAHECGMFLLSGAAMFSTGYLYQDIGGGGLAGWRLLNATLFGFIGIYVVLLFIAQKSIPSRRFKPDDPEQ